MENDRLSVRKTFSRIGIAMCVMVAVALGIQYLWFAVPEWVMGPENDLNASSGWTWLGSLIPMYVIAIPLFCLLIRKMPKTAIPEQKLGVNRFWTLLPICFFFMYAGNIIGNLLTTLITVGKADNFVEQMLQDNHPLKYIAVLIAAPVLEELAFRKLLLDRVAVYGEKTAVILSGVLFGLFHMNLFQFFYAFGLGVMLAYMYIRSGRIRYSMLVHGIINFVGSVIAPLMLQITEHPALADPMSADPMQTVAMLPLLLLASGFSTAILGMFICGIVMFCKRFKKAQWQEAPAQLPRGEVFKTVYLNVGIALFILGCGVLSVIVHFV